jgi:arabinoxylan arabinofuranohydrolase
MMKKRTNRIGAAVLTLAMVVSMIPGNVSKADSAGYSYFDDYSLGYANGGVVVFEGGTSSKPVAQTDVKIFDKEDDNPFEAQIEQAWDEPNLKLSMPVKYTTKDGEVHPVESMLTNFNFIADPTAIDNSDVDGKLYVYGTTEGFSYENGKMANNGYRNHSLTILSTSDMVNWTDEGFMDSQNLTNEPSYSDNKVKGGFTSGQSWAPSGLKYDGDNDGEDEYYVFYTNGGATGYVMSDSPTGPWRDPLGTALFSGSTPNCSDCSTCFDPAVLVDDKGDAYVYFGGLSRTSGRACQIGFDEATGEVYRIGDPVKLPTYAMFEDNEINQFNGKYYYSYCTDFNSQKLTGTASIAVYVSSDPLNVSFDPEQRPKGEEKTAFIDENGVYRHFLGTVLDNPSVIYGQSYNNHHHMQEFKDHYYILYHSTVLNNSIHRSSHSYRNLHVDEITVDEATDNIACEPSYEGAEQIENFNPYKNFDGSEKIINATTTSYSAGVKSTRDDDMVLDSKNGSPMVLDCIDTGDWTKIQGVDFGAGATEVAAEIKSNTNEGAIEVFIDDPTVASNKVASIPVNVKDMYDMVSVPVTGDVSGVHDVYFVFRGSDYTVASWKFTENKIDTPTTPDVPNPPVVTNPPVNTAVPSNNPSPSSAVDTTKAYTVGKADYKITDAVAATVQVASVDKKATSVVIPASVTIEGKAYAVTDIAANAFKNCKKLKSVTIGKNVKSIGAKAFYKCSSLKKITIKSTSLKKVGKAAFKGINAKAKIKVPAKKLKAYKKVLKGKGQKKSVKIK